MHSCRLSLLTLVLTFAAPPTIQAAYIADFEDFSPGQPRGTIYVDFGDFVATFEGEIHVDDTAPGFPALPSQGNVIHTGSTNWSPITLTFSDGFEANQVSLENYIFGYWSQEVDVFSLTAYDAAGIEIASVISGDQFPTITADGIARLVFDDVGTGFLLDNVTITAIPEPSTALIIGLGLAGLTRRRRYPASSSSRT